MSVCSVTWPMNASEAGVDLALIQTALLFSLNMNKGALKHLNLHNKRSEVCIETRSPAALLPFKGQVTKQTTVKWCTERMHMTSCMAAILVIQNNETEAMLVNQTNPVGVQLFSFVSTFFCSNKFAWLLDTRVHTCMLYCEET